MTHRADQIIDQVAAIVRARVEPLGYHVFKHRRLSLQAGQDELPAFSVDFGPDDPAEQNTGFIDSVLTVRLTFVTVSYDEDSLKVELLQMRREGHRALMADGTLGLSFVVSTTYGGAEEPEYGVNGERLLGVLSCPWLVYYRMNRDDPGDD